MKPHTLTANATRDDMTDDDYRDAYHELRAGKGLRKFVEMIGSAFSHATWAKYENGKMDINRGMRNELRRAVGLPELAFTVSEAIAHVSPDAEVVSITDAQTPDRLILAFSGDESKTIVLNGGIVVDPGVTKVTSNVSAKPRRKYYRACFPAELKAEIEADGRTPLEIMQAGLESGK